MAEVSILANLCSTRAYVSGARPHQNSNAAGVHFEIFGYTFLSQARLKVSRYTITLLLVPSRDHDVLCGLTVGTSGDTPA